MSTLAKREPIRARSAWKPSDFPAPAAYSFTLTEAHLAAFDAAIAVNRRAGRSVEELTARDFSLPSIAADVASWREEVLRGRGFIVLNTLPWATGAATWSTWAARIDPPVSPSRRRVARRAGDHAVSRARALRERGRVERGLAARLHRDGRQGARHPDRTSVEDDPDPARKRHLLRLWLMLDGERPLVPEVHAYKGTTGHEGTTTYYRGNAIPDDPRR